MLVTSPERLALVADVLLQCPDLRHVVVTGVVPGDAYPAATQSAVTGWADFITSPRKPGFRVIDVDMAAILYTSGSTGKPKGVV